ncbi:MAG: glycosyltransferase family 2 protein [Acidimicrobiales bacterium]
MDSAHSDTPATTVGLVILTTGDRPDELRSIMHAAGAQPFDQRILVGNGCVAPQLEGWEAIESAENLGVPGGRSFGMNRSRTDVVVFLDDDSSLPERSVRLVDDVRGLFDDDPTVGVVAFRVVVSGTDETLRRWSPKPSLSVPRGLTDVPTFPGNGHAIRRAAFNGVGGYLDELFFKHEETELSWRLLDAGWRVVADPRIVVAHPRTSEARHDVALELGLRNKLWILRLRLPFAIALIGSVISSIRSFARCRSFADVRAAARGFRQGVRSLPAPRRPVSWATVMKLTRSGRPPIF